MRLISGGNDGAYVISKSLGSDGPCCGLFVTRVIKMPFVSIKICTYLG